MTRPTPHNGLVPTGAHFIPVPEPRAPRRFGFLLLPEFTLLAFSAALDPLRIANQLAQSSLYVWSIYSEDGAPVRSSSGVDVNAHLAMSEIHAEDHLMVCSGNNHIEAASPAVLNTLRRHDRFGGKLGAICTGATALAQAGLLRGRRFTLHWENQPAFLETFPDLTPTDRRFEMDRTLLTSGGGAAAAELMLALIDEDYGRDFALSVSDMCLTAEDLSNRRKQRSSLSRVIQNRNPKLLAILHDMNAHIEEPLTLEDLAERAGISRRQMERLFNKYLSESPSVVYRNLRLDRARALLMETDQKVGEVAVACGFSLTGSFTRQYTARFGKLPSGKTPAQK